MGCLRSPRHFRPFKRKKNGVSGPMGGLKVAYACCLQRTARAERQTIVSSHKSRCVLSLIDLDLNIV